MRLIDTRTGFFHWVDNPSEVQYAILSHVWIPNEELSYEGLLAIHSAARESPDPRRYIFDAVPAKVREFCAFAQRHGISFGWIDTCCIDKSSSAELSEAINSMYKWYQLASLCVAYLVDVDNPLPRRMTPHTFSSSPKPRIFRTFLGFALPGGSTDSRSEGQAIGRDTVFDVQFRGSRWFKRGWTLQELIAPRSVLFVCRTWQAFGTKDSLADIIEDITGIAPAILTHKASLDSVSVATRLSWASDRVTTRVEDRAYSLMGLFGVHLPTIYGEGSSAFIRLQEEILKRVPDESLFVWGRILPSLSPRLSFADPGSNMALFAADPAEFPRYSWDPDIPTANQLQAKPHRWLAELLRKPDLPFPEYTTTCYGVRARLPLMRRRVSRTKTEFAVAFLSCVDSKGRVMALLLVPQDTAHREFTIGVELDAEVPNRYAGSALPRIVTISRQWIASERPRVSVEEIYLHHVDRSSRSPHPPPILSLVGVAQSTDPPALFNVRLTPWCRSVLEFEGYILLEDSWPTLVSTQSPGQPSLSLQSHVFHFVGSHLHIHITTGPCTCADGYGLLRVDASYRWRDQSIIGGSYVTPGELRPAAWEQHRSLVPESAHNPLLHVTTWTPVPDLSPPGACRELSIARNGQVVYTLRLTMQTRESDGSFLGVEVVRAWHKPQKPKRTSADVLEDLDPEISPSQLVREATEDMAGLKPSSADSRRRTRISYPL